MDPQRSRDEQELIRLFELFAGTTPHSRLHEGQIEGMIESLQRLTEEELISLGHKDSSCPICLTPFLSLLAEEETAMVMDSAATPSENLGVSRLAQCSHIFCRRDITKWIRDGHDSCPTCRRVSNAGSRATMTEHDLLPVSPFFPTLPSSLGGNPLAIVLQHPSSDFVVNLSNSQPHENDHDHDRHRMYS